MGTIGGGDFITWEARFSVGIPLMDLQHKQLIRLTNNLHDACREGSSSAQEAFGVAVREVVEYVKMHFSTEEKIMERVAYPDAAAHRCKHRDFVRQVLSEVSAFQSGRQFVPNRFTNFLRNWILEHIAETDKVMGAYVVKLAREGQFDSVLHPD